MFGVFAVKRRAIARSVRSVHASQHKRHTVARRVSGLFILTGLIVSGTLLPLSHALPGEYVWTKAGIVGLAGDKTPWKIASSADGTKFAAVAEGGYIYTSSNSGTTWTEQASAGTHDWSGIASSADGMKLAAVSSDYDDNAQVSVGHIYTSSDSGVTWTERTSAGSRAWLSITSSADGTKLVAIETSIPDSSTPNGYRGSIYTSTDSGATWTERTSAGSRAWLSITSSADGTKLAAVIADHDYIYTSSDSGVTWIPRTSAGLRYWYSITSSADGTKLAAVDGDYDGDIYISTDSGVTWIPRTITRVGYWYFWSIASSSDGTKLAAVEQHWDASASSYRNSIHTSSDSGATWTERTVTDDFAGVPRWSSIVSSADGTKLITASYNKNAGYNFIYISSDSGSTWAERTVAGLRGWPSIASSTDGTKLAAVVNNSSDGKGNYIYTSTDSGVTWTEQTSAGSWDWSSITSSADGTKLAATTYGGSIYTSSDSGSTWTERSVVGPQGWYSIASSADGMKLIAGAYNNGGLGSIYTSSDSGATWTEQISAGSHCWSSITSSADGTKLAAVDCYGSDGTGGYIYSSSDSGATWIEQTSAGSRCWSSIASSADGTKLAAVETHWDYDTSTAYGSVYTSSDSGATWTERTAAGSHNWYSVTSSADGTKLAAAGYGGSIYTSSDSGATWIEQTSAGSRYWSSIASSADGSKLIAGMIIGSIYLGSLDEGPTTNSFDYTTLPAPSGVQPAASESHLSLTSSACYTIAPNSTSILSPTGLTAPEQNVTLLGGIGYNVSCVTQGGSTDATVTLGTHYSDTSKLRIYKKAASSNTLTDITSQVTITNTTGSSPTTTFSYTLQDGGDYDEDGVVNGTIVDPVFIGLAGTTGSTPTGTLAETGMNMWPAVLTGGGLLLVGGGLLRRQ